MDGRWAWNEGGEYTANFALAYCNVSLMINSNKWSFAPSPNHVVHISQGVSKVRFRYHAAAACRNLP